MLLMFFGCSGWNIQQFNLMQEKGWTMNGHDARRSWNAGRSVQPPLKLLWSYDASSATGSPVAANSILFVGTYRGELHAISINDGERIGRISLEGVIHGTPVLDNSIIYIALASGENTFQAVDVTNGDMVWGKKLGPIETSPIQHNLYLYVTTMDGHVYCLEKTTGKEIWKYSIPNLKGQKNIHSSPATDGNVLVFGCDDGVFYALDARTGNLRWKVQTGKSILGSPAISADRVIIGSTDHVLYALNIADGSVCWKSDFGGILYSSPAIAESTVVIGAANGCIRALSVITGNRVWEYRASSVVSAPGVVCGNIVYIGTLDHILYAFNIQSGKVFWSDTLEGRIKNPPISWNGMIFVPVEDKYIYAYVSNNENR
ncbi:MAG: PQQ-binding-like beta-propeller repeat protein [Bacteroidota bacterium]